ncbi:hypothetical protein GCM10011380_25910 [Sphingomonas metalli]|uniref:Uncharacterized protein n=1 Tax=Sphingomonas metalli TaxID=1779358 RepID=A0A916T840_9SPHN|nr:hypothetical protein [Sphingomonas metalli]GGB35332.1 hypothetical protein GCM10011380_25910 [Sphingomonas metalli]
MIHVLLFYVLLVGACGYALRCGGAPERWVAVLLPLAALSTFLVAILGRGYHGGQFRHVEYGILAVDAVLLLALVAVAALADRFWPLCLSALHAFGLVAHLARMIAPDILPDVYKAAHAIASYPILLTLVVATYRHRQRVHAHGRDRSWSISWPALMPTAPVRTPTG